jgi:5,10-methylenetetrahydromethanopterin reductase
VGQIAQLGLLLPKHLGVSQFLELSVRCEAIGLDGVWLAEDCFTASGPAMAAMILERTSSLRVALGILPAAARNVAFTAMEVATLANAHPGRLTVGIGHGMPEWMRQVGVWPASPVAAFEETIVALCALLRGESVTSRGRHVQLDSVQLAQPPEVVPQVLAGVRGPRSLAASGRVANGTILCEPTTPEYIHSALVDIGRGMAGAARPHRVVAYNWLAPSTRAGTTALRAVLGSSLSMTQAAQLAPLEFGARLLELATQEADPAGGWLKDEWLAQLAIPGEPGIATERIEQLVTAGADTCVLVPVPGIDPFETLEIIGELLRHIQSQ